MEPYHHLIANNYSKKHIHMLTALEINEYPPILVLSEDSYEEML